MFKRKRGLAVILSFLLLAQVLFITITTFAQSPAQVVEETTQEDLGNQKDSDKTIVPPKNTAVLDGEKQKKDDSDEVKKEAALTENAEKQEGSEPNTEDANFPDADLEKKNEHDSDGNEENIGEKTDSEEPSDMGEEGLVPEKKTEDSSEAPKGTDEENDANVSQNTPDGLEDTKEAPVEEDEIASDSFELFSDEPLTSIAGSFADQNLVAAICSELDLASADDLNAENIKILTTLSVAGISSFEGLQQATQLTSLTASGSGMASFAPLKSLPNLTYLDLSGNGISDVSQFAGFSSVKTLKLNNNYISSLYELRMVAESFEIFEANNQTMNSTIHVTMVDDKFTLNTDVRGYGDSRTPTTLEPTATTADTTAIWNKEMGQVEVVTTADLNDEVYVSIKWSHDLPYSNHSFSGTTNFTCIIGYKTHSIEDAFEDENLLKMVKETLWTFDNVVLTEDMLQMLNQLNIPSDITSLKGLEYATNLRQLQINGNVGDWSGISAIPSLKQLFLQNTNFTDFSLLKDFLLNWLSISNSNISNLSGLENLNNLSTLTIKNSQVSNVSAIGSLTGLKILDLNNNKISNLAPLSSLTGLEFLSLAHNQIVDISPLQYLTSLIGLDLSNNQISDISPLVNLTNLDSLLLSNNNIYDPSVVPKDVYDHSFDGQKHTINLGKIKLSNGSFTVANPVKTPNGNIPPLTSSGINGWTIQYDDVNNCIKLTNNSSSEKNFQFTSTWEVDGFSGTITWLFEVVEDTATSTPAPTASPNATKKPAPATTAPTAAPTKKASATAAGVATATPNAIVQLKLDVVQRDNGIIAQKVEDKCYPKFNTLEESEGYQYEGFLQKTINSDWLTQMKLENLLNDTSQCFLKEDWENGKVYGTKAKYKAIVYTADLILDDKMTEADFLKATGNPKEYDKIILYMENHTLMIDAIVDGIVYYTDYMEATEAYYSQKELETVEKPLDEFIKSLNKKLTVIVVLSKIEP